MFEKSNTKVIEIYSKLVIENLKILAIPNGAIENLSIFIGKVRNRLSVQVSVIK